MTETIITANDGWPTVCVLGEFPFPRLKHLAILAWSITNDGVCTPITPLGKVDPGGAWLVRDQCGNFLCSDGSMYRDQGSATAWLEWRAKGGGQ